ncbi:Gfo/Idh/MocA family oxidoreductase [Paenibacillus alginolyticus]|uniref:Gfo/Idh/MocA family oxidoreductase n=1 Tax=Paenibacillus alginolyticus TaxID=59839 RepID=A0ABT4GPD8_9BACL|nr:Gfo/Idh/MocA family oxidoreductase [Paenibacillus alginolyticus]MCY9664292.1 Gfo/Idh/MocA family oxidoreductase [Paenibacillus alginolyticus]MCY9698074.1 Gfo/Idh/MocA family oxidoreductase [Paenibacillus alginolyticus]MEC0148198.1 Gfo/Idh/MocA family oxidoreductase [Paenibacillus alginolyticus]
MSTIRVGMIGTGGISQWHARQLLELKEVEIKAITDTSSENREKFAAKFSLTGVKQFSEYQDMLDQVELDAVVICSPHTLHFQQATDVLNKGLHVLIEKPMTCSSEEAEQLITTAEKAGKVLQVSYQRHFQPEFLFIRDAIANGEIGKLTSITASLYQEWKQGTTGLWRQVPELSGGGMLMDSGSHIIDVLLWTTGLTPVEVKPSLHLQGAPVEIDSFTSIRFAEGAVAGLNVVGYAPCWHETYVFCGEEGGIFYDNGKITIRRLHEEPVVPELPKQTTNQDKSFIDAILGRHEVKVPGSFALKVVKFTEMIYQAAGYKPY